MSQRNVELLRHSAELLNVGDWDSFLELYHPDVEVEFRDLRPPRGVPDVLRGREAIRRVVAHWTAPYDQLGAEVSEYIDADPWVVCDTHSHGRGGVGTPTFQVHFADAYEVRDGQIVRAILGYADVAAALGDIAPTEPV
jgi:ketosteroid isomerase-like protein